MPTFDLVEKKAVPRIVCAANRITIQVGEEQKQFVVAGARHHDCVMNPIIIALVGGDRDKILEKEQGFIDQFGQYHTRHEAWAIAEANNQIVRRCGGDGADKFGLFSENLY